MAARGRHETPAPLLIFTSLGARQHLTQLGFLPLRIVWVALANVLVSQKVLKEVHKVIGSAKGAGLFGQRSSDLVAGQRVSQQAASKVERRRLHSLSGYPKATLATVFSWPG
jgi:hypothetical protein